MRQEDIFRLHRDLAAIAKRLEELRGAVQEYSKAILSLADKPAQKEQTPQQVLAKVGFDEPTAVAAQQEKDRQYRVQRQIRNATRAAVLAAVLYAGVAVFQWSEMRKATKAAQRTADTASAQLAATDRPWVKAVPQSWSPLTFRENGDLTLNVTFALSNVGRSVATDVTIYSGAMIPGRKAIFTVPLERQTELCKKAQPAGLRFALFPNETKQLGVGVTISRGEIEANPVQLPPGPPQKGKRIQLMLYGCADYRFASREEHHQTGFIYDIVRLEPKFPGVPFLIVVDENLSADRIGLNRWVFGGDYAN